MDQTSIHEYVVATQNQSCICLHQACCSDLCYCVHIPELRAMVLWWVRPWLERESPTQLTTYTQDSLADLQHCPNQNSEPTNINLLTSNSNQLHHAFQNYKLVMITREGCYKSSVGCHCSLLVKKSSDLLLRFPYCNWHRAVIHLKSELSLLPEILLTAVQKSDLLGHKKKLPKELISGCPKKDKR